MGMTQKLLGEQFADLLVQMSFIFQDLVITMSFVVQTQFSSKSCSLAVKKVEDYFGRKEYREQPNRFLCDLWKKSICVHIFLPQHTLPIREKKPIQFLHVYRALVTGYMKWCRVLIISGSSPWKYIREYNVLVLSWRIYVHWCLTVKICSVATACASNFQEERKVHSRWKENGGKVVSHTLHAEPRNHLVADWSI